MVKVIKYMDIKIFIKKHERFHDIRIYLNLSVYGHRVQDIGQNL